MPTVSGQLAESNMGYHSINWTTHLSNPVGLTFKSGFWGTWLSSYPLLLLPNGLPNERGLGTEDMTMIANQIIPETFLSCEFLVLKMGRNLASAAILIRQTQYVCTTQSLAQEAVTNCLRWDQGGKIAWWGDRIEKFHVTLSSYTTHHCT